MHIYLYSTGTRVYTSRLRAYNKLINMSTNTYIRIRIRIRKRSWMGIRYGVWAICGLWATRYGGIGGAAASELQMGNARKLGKAGQAGKVGKAGKANASEQRSFIAVPNLAPVDKMRRLHDTHVFVTDDM